METYGPQSALEALRPAELETGFDRHHSAYHLGPMAFAEYGPAASATVTEVADTCYESVVRQSHLVLTTTDFEPFCSPVPDRWGNRCRRPLEQP